EALGRIVPFTERPPVLLRARPSNVVRALAVAGLAADADFGPGGSEAIVCRVVVFVHSGRMALGTHEVPILVQFGPMQYIIVFDLLVRIEMEPALAGLIFRPAVPGDRQRLQAPVRKLDQILLQRVNAESVLDLEHAELAVRPVRFDEELSFLAEE